MTFANHTGNTINITLNMELYDVLDDFMKNIYVFNNDILKNYKDDDKLIWYSYYYDPYDEWSTACVSCLSIERQDFWFKIWCTKKLDEIIDRPHKSQAIGFSPELNGKYSKNLNKQINFN